MRGYLSPTEFRTRGQIPAQLATLLGTAVLAVFLMLSVLPDEPLVDEHYHLAQIRSINSDEFARVPYLTTPLGYHFSVALPARLLGVESLRGLRAISATWALLSLVLAWFFLLRHGAARPLLRSLQVLLCPLVWPFCFLLYTDLGALTLVLAALVAFGSRSFWTAAAIGTLALAWRQTNVFWSGLLWLMALHQAGVWQTPGALNWRSLLHRVRVRAVPALQSSWMLMLPLVVFVAFVILNQGVALGDREAHRFGQAVYPGQVFFMLLVVWLVLLPLHAANLARIVELLGRRPWVGLLIAALGVLYLTTFSVTHFYNLGLPEFHLRNRVLGWMVDHHWFRLLAFAGMAWALLSIAVTRLKDPAGYWLYPVTILALLPVELIEQRYYIVPVILFLLFRQPRGATVEWSVLAWFAGLSAAVTAAIASQDYFL